MSEKIYREDLIVLPEKYLNKGKTYPKVHLQLYSKQTNRSINLSTSTIEVVLELFNIEEDVIQDIIPQGTVGTPDVDGNLIYEWSALDTNRDGVLYLKFIITHADSTIEQIPPLDGLQIVLVD